MKIKLPLIVAVVLGLIAILAIHSYVSRVRRAALEGMEIERVVVAREDIPPGTAITLDLIEPKEVPVRFIDTRAVFGRENVAMIMGQKTRHRIRAGDQILWSDLGVERVEGLAAIISAGERAITIAVDGITGVAGLIRPNDHVDILGTFTVAKEGGGRGAEAEMVTVTLLQNVTILATGREVAGERRERGRERGGRGYPSVTLAVTPTEAEILVFAQQQGRLTLSLRNPEDIEIMEELPRIDFDALIELVPGLTRERKERIEVIRGRRRTLE